MVAGGWMCILDLEYVLEVNRPHETNILLLSINHDLMSGLDLVLFEPFTLWTRHDADP